MEQAQIDEIRDFNRFYAKVIGLLDKTYLNSDYSLAEVRVLREISINPQCGANDILYALGLDKGYLSRILKSFERKKLISKIRSTTDKRAIHLTLTDLGKREFEILDEKANEQVSNAFAQVSEGEYEKLIHSMKTIRTILNK